MYLRIEMKVFDRYRFRHRRKEITEGFGFLLGGRRHAMRQSLVRSKFSPSAWASLTGVSPSLADFEQHVARAPSGAEAMLSYPL
jgi:hypothetical protein